MIPMDRLINLIRPEVRLERPYIVAGATVVENKLNQNECPYDLPSEFKEELITSFMQIPFNRYPTEQPDRLVSALASRLNHPRDGILVGNGSNELTHTVGLCLMSSPARVVVPKPMFALYESVARMYGATIIGVAPRDDLSLDMGAIHRASAQSDVHLTIVTSPNNPTGLSVTFDEIKALCEQAPGFVVIDEAYHEFNSERSAIELLPHHPNLIIMRTLSKAFGLAGIRIGYMMGAPAVIQEFLKARLPFMVSRFSEHVALELLKRPEFIEDRVARIKSGIRELTDTLEAMSGIDVVRSQSNFVLFKMGHPSSTLVQMLTEEGVLVRDMSGYPELTGYLRVTAGTDAENKAFFRALESVRSRIR
jgi:histidinol-phosphate aminotransferase